MLDIIVRVGTAVIRYFLTYMLLEVVMMAILKIRKEDRTIELPVDIYGDKNAPKKQYSPTVNNNNGLITQTIPMELYVGDHKIFFPLSYANVCSTVIVDQLPDELKSKVYVVEHDLSSCTIKVLPHAYDKNTVAQIVTTGY